MAINGINGLNGISPAFLSDINKIQDNGESSVSFADLFNEALNNANNLLLESDKITNDFAAGKTDNIQQVMIAAEKADIALQFTMQIRNKILDAYSEIMRMQI